MASSFVDRVRSLSKLSLSRDASTQEVVKAVEKYTSETKLDEREARRRAVDSYLPLVHQMLLCESHPVFAPVLLGEIQPLLSYVGEHLQGTAIKDNSIGVRLRKTTDSDFEFKFTQSSQWVDAIACKPVQSISEQPESRPMLLAPAILFSIDPENHPSPPLTPLPFFATTFENIRDAAFAAKTERLLMNYLARENGTCLWEDLVPPGWHQGNTVHSFMAYPGIRKNEFIVLTPIGFRVFSGYASADDQKSAHSKRVAWVEKHRQENTTPNPLAMYLSSDRL
jgi:hypothetical protein